jgi:predicted tellurium resistance membrane protein TerC
MADALGLLALLIGLELVLGVDNVLVIAIFVGRLPENKRQKARIIGLSLALVARIVMLAVVVALASLTRPIVANFSVRDLILLAGGLFLLYKAVHEIHHTVEFREEADGSAKQANAAFASIITQIVLLDIVFSSIRWSRPWALPRNCGSSFRRWCFPLSVSSFSPVQSVILSCAIPPSRSWPSLF